MIKNFITIILFTILFFNTALAQNAPQGSVLESLRRQIFELQKRINDLSKGAIVLATNSMVFDRNLNLGKSGEDVKKLQEFLANIPGVYPEKNVSGYFGRLTAEALKRFQAKYQIPTTGFFGPLTRAKLNEFWTRGAQVSGLVLPVVPVSPPATSSPVAVIEKMNTASTTSDLSKSAVTTTGTSTQFQLQVKPNYDLNVLAVRTQEMINRKREESSLATLLWDDSLARVAYEHSGDQAKDNIEITSPALICHYPMIRHEGFISGFSLKERLESRNVVYRSAGENIAILPVGKRFIYEYPADDPVTTCAKIEDFKSGVDSKDEATRKYNAILASAREAVKNLGLVKWVNREWATPEEIAQKVVEGWLNSPGHRKNIMNPAFNFGGMGIVAVNDYLIFTHNFVGR